MATDSRPKEAGTVASSSAHLRPILPQPADPQQVSERRYWKTHQFHFRPVMPLSHEHMKVIFASDFVSSTRPKLLEVLHFSPCFTIYIVLFTFYLFISLFCILYILTCSLNVIGIVSAFRRCRKQGNLVRQRVECGGQLWLIKTCLEFATITTEPQNQVSVIFLMSIVLIDGNLGKYPFRLSATWSV